jgi:hypothetical protein
VTLLAPVHHVRHSLLVVGSTLALLAGLLISAGPTLAVGGSEFVRITNEYRAGQGLDPVALHAGVDTIAAERANQMAAAREMAHDLDYVKQRLAQLGVCWTNVGEIIAYERGYPTHSYERTMNQWWSSPGHHAIIVGDFDAAGGSWSIGSNSATYSAMIFVKTCAPPVARSATVIGRAALGAGTHTGVRFSGSTIVASKTATLASRSGADVSERARIGGRVYLRIVNGIWAGYWIPETWRSYLPGWFDKVSFDAPQRLVFDAGTHVGFKYYSSGNWYARKAATLSRRSGADAAGWAIINGRAHYYVINGIWAGYWVPDTANLWPAP